MDVVVFFKGRGHCHLRFEGSFGSRVSGLIDLLGGGINIQANRASIASNRSGGVIGIWLGVGLWLGLGVGRVGLPVGSCDCCHVVDFF